MKKIFLLLLNIILFLSALQAQTTPQKETLTPEQEKSFSKIQELNLKLVNLYKEKKFDEAIVIGKDILEIAQGASLLTDLPILTVITNLSEVYLVKGKESEAISIFKIVADGYQKAGNKSALEKTISRLIAIYVRKNDLKNAEPNYIKLIEIMESSYGAKNQKVANISLQLANIYNSLKKPEKAEQYYLKAIEINDLVLSEKEKDERKDVDNYKCFCYHRAFQQNNLSGADKALKELDKKRGFSPDDNLKKGIINGKALNLVKPKYPERAKELRATGFAIVSVEIDEQGTVVKAKATCGFLDFVDEVEMAAMNSKFSPTLRNGIPVRVTGDIVYNFTATVR